MTRFISGFLFIGLMVLGASTASAQAPSRTFLSSTGSDANPCSSAAPCRTLGVAISTVAEGGEVIILDSGGYGEKITITKSVSVLAPAGVVARLRIVEDGSAVAIDGANIRVTIDGVGITGSGPGARGVRFQAGAALVLRNMDINVVSGTGVEHNASGGELLIEHSLLRNAVRCFRAQTTSGLVVATIVNVQASNCYQGFYAGGLSSVSIQRSSATGKNKLANDSYACFIANGTADGTAYLSVDNVKAHNCYYGVASGPQATGGPGSISVSNSLITGTAEPIRVLSGSSCVKAGNNRLFNNDSNTAGGCTVTAGQ